MIKEAALDSPTFRATAVHFGDQIELIERWLDSFVRATSRLASELNTLQGIVDTYVQASHPPLQLSEAILDHDYTVLALKRFGEGAREYWNSTCRSLKKAETSVCEPIRAFLNNDLRVLKEARKNLDLTQRAFDGAIARYASQVKSKEASSLREDAFQLHEARRAYLQASMNFCVLAPQVRLTLDKVLVKVIHEQWRDMKTAKDAPTKAFVLGNTDIERVRGWSKEMENGERVFKRELHLARQQVEQAAELSARPSRDLDSYAASTVAYLGTPGQSNANLPSPAKPDPANEKAEKQGWLFQRTITGKPARTYWVRRWFFVKNGIFGWLTQGTRSGAVEESEKIGVLLCGIRPAFQEERRFCFEVKTKDTTILLQAETQNDITEWIAAFEVAKRKALEDTSKETPGTVGSVDAAFSISPPVAPEFAAKTSEGHAAHTSDDITGLDRAETSLGIPGGEASRGASMDVSRRGTGLESEMGRRDHAARIMEKLDLSRKSTAGPQLSGSNPSSATGGIASLISASLASASHNIVQVGQIAAPAPGLPDTRLVMGQTLPYTSLSPNTLANPPAPTNLSKAAVAVSGERGLGIGKSGNMPGGLMANLWGSVNWGYVNKIGKPDEPGTRDRSISGPPSPINSPPGEPFDVKTEGAATQDAPASAAPAVPGHRKTISLGGTLSRPSTSEGEFPNYYPAALRMQDAQFRILFPTVPRAEKLVLVFRAVWNPTEQQEFPGRVYVTTNDIYFYSNHLGLVLVTGIVMSQIDEVTAAPGKDCDFLFLHFKTGAREDGATRITVKTFLEPLKLLQRRLNFLVRNATTGEHDLEEVIKALIRMEADDNQNSAGEEGWEEISPDTPMDPRYGGKNIKTSLRIDGNLFGPSGVGASKTTAKFKLPSQPVMFAPAGMQRVAVEKEYDISAKALFHILFGDKSAVFQLLYRERLATRVVQGPWTAADKTHQRRDFEYEIAQPGKNGANIVINDYQVIEVMNDHLCYVVSDRKTPWYLPGHERFVLLSKVVITHVSKARCKLSVHTKIDWKRNPRIVKKLIERQGLQDLELEAQDLVDVVNDQVARLGHNRSTGKVTNIFGQIGVQNQAVQMNAEDIPPPNRPRKFKLRPTTTGSFIAQYVGNVIISVLSTVMSWVLAIFAGIGNVVSAHKLLVALLLVSGGANFFYTSKDSWAWWNERNAASYMSRLGVGPSTSMTRLVYLRDIAEAFANPNDTNIELALPTAGISDNRW